MKVFTFFTFVLSSSVLITACAVEAKKEVPQIYRSGQEHYHRACANCHGPDAMGGGGAPKLIQEKFSAANYSDIKFAQTIVNGSDSGVMPSQKQKVSEKQINEIIKYLRYSQKESGLT